MGTKRDSTPQALDIPWVRAAAVAPVVRRLDRLGVATDMLLAGHGMLRSELSDPYAVLPMARYIALLEDAARTVGDSAFGASLGAAFKPSDMGPIGVLFSLSSTMRHAFQRIAKLINSLQGVTSSALFDEGEIAIFNYSLIDAALWPRRQDSEYSIATSCHLVRSCFSPSWNPLEIHFEHSAPADLRPLQRIFRAPIFFDQPTNRIVMKADEIDRIYRQEDLGLIRILERHVAELISEANGPVSLSQKIRALIGAHLGNHEITVDLVSSELGMSRRTLQRRLRDENTSLREILVQYRAAIAEVYLTRPRMTMSSIALTLGYADGTVFWRAFRNWDGSAPSRRRRRGGGLPDSPS